MTIADSVSMNGGQQFSRLYAIRRLFIYFLVVTVLMYFLWNVYTIRANQSLLNRLLQFSKDIKKDLSDIRAGEAINKTQYVTIKT